MRTTSVRSKVIKKEKKRKEIDSTFDRDEDTDASSTTQPLLGLTPTVPVKRATRESVASILTHMYTQKHRGHTISVYARIDLVKEILKVRTCQSRNSIL